MFRNYGSFGYITDNRNFGYKETNDNGNEIGDKIVSQSGAVFLSVLNNMPQTIECLSKKISLQFTDVNIETIKIDAIEFYSLLESEGFIVSDNSLLKCNEKDKGFSYKKVKLESKNEVCSLNDEHCKSTQVFFEEYFNNEPQLTNLHLEITSQCNERCVHCYIPHEYKVNSMDSDMFYNILEQCKEMNLLNITISGGEPMIHSNFIDYLKKCNEYNFSVNILSNLTLLSDDILEEMKRNRLLSVQVSLYSMDANIHDSITQIEGSFHKTKKAILRLVENEIPLQISCPILKQNINCFNDVVDWGGKYNINVGSDYVIIAGYNHTTQNLNSRLDINDVKEVIHQRITRNTKYLEMVEKEADKKRNLSPDDYICSVCNSTICIAENGNVYPCAGWQDYVLGNINEKLLVDIWYNSIKVQYLRNLRRRDFPKCLQCTENEFCTMCMVRNANEDPFGDPLVVNEYFCNIVKLNKEIVLDWKRNCIKSRCKS